MKRILAIVCLLVAVAIASAQEWAWPVLARQASQRQVRSSALTDTPQYEHLVGWWLPRGLAPQADESGAFLRDWSQAGNYMTQATANAIAPVVQLDNLWAWRGTNANVGSGGDFMAITTSNVTAGATAMTYSAWVRLDVTRANAGIIAMRNVSTLSGVHIQSAGSSNVVRIAASFFPISPANQTGQWVHVAATLKWNYTGTQDRVICYLNGYPVSTNATTAGGDGHVAQSFWNIGRDAGNAAHNYAGGITDARIYETVLSDQEILEVYQEVAP
jgi:hypothetical protein